MKSKTVDKGEQHVLKNVASSNRMFQETSSSKSDGILSVYLGFCHSALS